METTPTSRTVLHWRRHAFPIHWEREFGRNGPLMLEVGFGDGRFTVQSAQLEPELNIVGLEVSTASLMRAKKRVEHLGLNNIRLAKANAFFAIRHLFAPESLAVIIVNFPDPWPKEKHTKHRLLQHRFFTVAATRLVPGGEIRLATDHPEYLAFAESEALASGLFATSAPEPPQRVFETKYALKWRDQGKPLYYRVFTKTAHPTEVYPPLQRSETMPHSILTGSAPTIPAFDKLVFDAGGGHVIVHEAATVNTEHTRVLFRVSVDEPDLHQQLLIVLQERKSGEFIVRLEPFGDPVITKAVRGAIGAITDWLATQAGVTAAARHY